MTVQSASYGFLHNTLRGNFVFSLTSGALAALAAWPLASYLGIPSPWILVALGLGVFGFGLLVRQTVNRTPFDIASVRMIAVADVVWVVASVGLLLLPGMPFTTEGRWVIGIVAEIVALFAVLEIYGLRRAR